MVSASQQTTNLELRVHVISNDQIVTLLAHVHLHLEEQTSSKCSSPHKHVHTNTHLPVVVLQHGYNFDVHCDCDAVNDDKRTIMNHDVSDQLVELRLVRKQTSKQGVAGGFRETMVKSECLAGRMKFGFSAVGSWVAPFQLRGVWLVLFALCSGRR
jgi:hypothetical protein